MMPSLAVMNAIRSAMASMPDRWDASPTTVQAKSAALFNAARISEMLEARPQ
jgi:hypothetical protein